MSALTFHNIPITTYFGQLDSDHKTPHTGIDIAMPLGTHLHAFASGQVVKATWDNKLGNTVWIRLHDGYTAIYAHLSTAFVRAGDYVFNGQIIGESGSSGNSTGPHLHFAILTPQGHFIDPSQFVFLPQVLHPKLLYGTGDWASSLATSWFSSMGDALSSAFTHTMRDLIMALHTKMPDITITALMIAAFLHMCGFKKWSARFFITSGVMAGWVLMF